MAFDPFGDRERRGYLQNRIATNDMVLVHRLEDGSFNANVGKALERLGAAKELDYGSILQTHKVLFEPIYPWAGQDRTSLAPTIAISRGGYDDLFAHPADVRRAAEYALSMGSDAKSMKTRPGEVFGALAYSHPFLDGNGRALLTVHTDMAARAGFHIDWAAISKQDFLAALTAELKKPGSAMEGLVAHHIREGAQSIAFASATMARRGLSASSSASPSPTV